jgi:hypothetical protein
MGKGMNRCRSVPAAVRLGYLDRASLAAGLGLLCWVVLRRPAGIYDAAIHMGPIAFLSPLIALAWFPTHTTALWVLLDRDVPWGGLFFNRLVGEGYNALLPMAGLGGEPFKLRHLTRFITADRAVAGLVRDRVISNGIGFLFSAGWLVATLPALDLPVALRDGLWGYVAAAMAIGGLSLWLVVSRLPGRFGRLLGRLLSGTAKEPPRLAPRRALQAGLWSMVSRFLGMCEIGLLLSTIGVPFHLTTVAFVDSALNAAGFALGFAVPQGIGVLEGSSVYVLGCLGVEGPSAVAFALVRRGRILCLSLLGVALHLIDTARRPAAGTAV